MKHYQIHKFFGSTIALCGLLAGSSAASEWMDLFDGETLDGWETREGNAEFVVENGVIKGTTANGPNTYLCTIETFDDFELEYETKVDNELNSGVQIRSRAASDGDVFGPQVEAEKSVGQSGWIYGEDTGFGWLSEAPTVNDRDVNRHSYFINGQWNHFRVVADGLNIKTWVNGNPVADLNHEETYATNPSGFIGLQVHRVNNGGPYRAYWRNIRLRELPLTGEPEPEPGNPISVGAVDAPKKDMPMASDATENEAMIPSEIEKVMQKAMQTPDEKSPVVGSRTISDPLSSPSLLQPNNKALAKPEKFSDNKS